MKFSKCKTTLKAAVVLAAMAAFSVGAYAAQGGVPGKPGGNNGGGGGSQSPDLGDLFILYRDASGLPILTADSCQQPLAAPGVRFDNPDGTECTPPDSSTNSCVVPVDPTTCAVAAGYEQYTQEVDFGRTSVVRSPASVLESQMDDVLVNLGTAACTSLDPAGRLVTSSVADTDTNDVVVTSAEIDSPLQNLAIYRQLMLTGYLGTAAAPVDVPDNENPPNVLNTAARALGAAMDKTGKISVDTVAYLNQILGLTDEGVQTYLPKSCIEVKEEVQGAVQMVRKCFLDYSAFNYDRGSNFATLPSPAYIPASAPAQGWFEYLTLLDTTPTFQIAQGPILDAVPQLSADPSLAASNIAGFAQAADDTRAVIDFMHTWPVPGEYATPVPCETSGGTTGYDVSISPESGLQVPVRMVAGTEGREFTLTVANAGPAVATGIVLLTAVDADGNAIPTFPRTYSFDDLAAGTSQSWTESFSVDTVTTVTWTATVEASGDVNPGNNSVTETTKVIGQGGGQGGGGGHGSAG